MNDRYRIEAVIACALLFWGGSAQATGFAFSVGKGLSAVDVATVGGLTELGTRIGFHTGGLAPFAVIDYARVAVDEGGHDFAGSLLTLGAGARYLFNRTAGKASPYFVGGLFTVIPNAENNGDAINEVSDSSSIGLTGGFGAEYFAAESFSVGAELGLNYLSIEIDNSFDGSYTQFYSALTMNFYL